MKNKNESLAAVQQAELDILRTFDAICLKHQLDYFIDCGTLLGAIRHQGFIPWDDDIDVGMMRSDYEKFLKIAQKELGKEYFLQTRETDPNYPLNFAKIRKNHTTFVEWAFRTIDMHHGVYIDIFVYDVLPQENQSAFIQQCIRADKEFVRKFVPVPDSKPEWSLPYTKTWLKKRVVHFLYRFKSEQKIENHVKNLLTQAKDTDYPSRNIACLVFKEEYIVPESIVFPTSTVTFEGLEFSAPNDPEAYLKLMYGDYLTLPPEEERTGHRPAFVDLNTSWSAKDIRKKI